MRFWLLLAWVFCAIASFPFLADRWELSQLRNSLPDLPRVTLADLTGRADAPLRLAMRDGTDGWYVLPADRIAPDLALGMGTRPARDGWVKDEVVHVPHPCGDSDGKIVLAAFPEGTRLFGFCDPYSADLAPLRALARSADFMGEDVPVTQWHAMRDDLVARDDAWVLTEAPDLTHPFTRRIDLPWVWVPDAGDEPAATVAAQIAALLDGAAGEAVVSRRDWASPSAAFGGGSPESGRMIVVFDGRKVVPADLVHPRQTSFTVTCARAEVCDRLAAIDPAAIAAPYRPEALLTQALERGEMMTGRNRPSALTLNSVDILMRISKGENTPTRERSAPIFALVQPGLSR